LEAKQPIRRRRKEARPSEIVEAARNCFIAKGFAKTRVEEVARRAGVSKGTVYVYFPSKEALFEAVIRTNVLPVLEQARAMVASDPDIAASTQLKFLVTTFYRELVGTDRKKLLHLIIAEGPNFPWLTEFYYREILSKGLGLFRAIIERGVERGEFRRTALSDFPEILVAPAVIAALFALLFGRTDPAQIERYMEAHLAAALASLGAE
jgi:AcrR family transcriptional regulator